MTFSHVEYGFAEAAYLFLLVLSIPLLGWYLYSHRKENAFPSIPRSRYNYSAKVIALTVASALATFALMEPKGNGRYLPGAPVSESVSVKRRVHDVIFLIDASASMDFKDTKTYESRLENAKEIVDEIIAKLHGESVALWAFAGEPSKLSPLTLDHLFVRLMLKNLEINEGDVPGTNFLKALTSLKKEYFSKISERYRTVVILSDGGDGAEDLSHLLGDAELLNLRVYTVGMGSKEGEHPLNGSFLKKIAESARGAFYEASRFTTLQIVDDIALKIQKESLFKEIKAPSVTPDALIYDLYFQIPLGGALLLLIFFAFFPNTRIRKGILILFICFQGEVWGGEAATYFEAGEYEKAIEAYETLSKSNLKPWQMAAVQYNIGISYLASGDRESAIRTLKDIQTTSPVVLEHIRLALDSLTKEDMKKKPERVRGTDPESILKSAIEYQEYAIQLNRISSNEAKEAQEEVFKIAEEYYPSVLDYEKRSYPKTCQCSPWDHAIPLFEEGYRLAKWKIAYLPVQEEILRYWRQALNIPPKPFEKPDEAVLKALQEMHLEDTLPKEKKNTEGGPW